MTRLISCLSAAVNQTPSLSSFVIASSADQWSAIMSGFLDPLAVLATPHFTASFSFPPSFPAFHQSPSLSSTQCSLEGVEFSSVFANSFKRRRTRSACSTGNANFHHKLLSLSLSFFNLSNLCFFSRRSYSSLLLSILNFLNILLVKFLQSIPLQNLHPLHLGSQRFLPLAYLLIRLAKLMAPLFQYDEHPFTLIPSRHTGD